MRCLCIAIGFATALVAVGTTPVRADKARWCASLGPDDGMIECLYHSLEQCRATLAGFGGFCYENPDHQPTAQVRSNRKKHRRYD